MASRRPQDDPDSAAEDQPVDLEPYVTGLVNVVDKGMTSEVLPYGITLPEFSLLRNCMDKETTATQLAQVLPVDGARISRLVNVLVDRGLLRRRRLRSDRRIVMLSLSERGRELTSQVVQEMESYNANLMEGISREEMRTFLDVASKIIANYTASQGEE